MSVDYYLDGAQDVLVLLSFSGPVVVLADALAELFEAPASTVRWAS